MIYIWYFIILPLIYIICNIFYFIYRFKFFPWKSLNKTYIKYWKTFSSYYLEDNKHIFYDSNTPLATFLICYSKEETLYDAIKIAEDYLKNIGSKETVNTELIVISLKKIYYGGNKFYLERMSDWALAQVADMFSVPKVIVNIPGNALANETSDIYHVKPKKKKFGEKKLSKKQRKCKQKQ